jgi:hypothetical protein
MTGYIVRRHGRIGAVFLFASGLLANGAAAQDSSGAIVVEWTNYNGWAEGAEGERQTFGPALNPTMSARFVRVRENGVETRVCNNGRTGWYGLLEMSDDYSWGEDRRTRLRPGECTTLRVQLNPAAHKYYLIARSVNGSWPE